MKREIKKVTIDEIFKRYKLTLTVIKDGIKVKDNENMDKLVEYWKKKNFTCLLSNFGEIYLTDGEDKILVGVIIDHNFLSWYKKIN